LELFTANPFEGGGYTVSGADKLKFSRKVSRLEPRERGDAPMPITLRRIDQLDLNLVVYSGRVEREEMLAFCDGLSEHDPANAAPWLSYFKPDTDLPVFDPPFVAELKTLLAGKLRAWMERRPLTTVMVCNCGRCSQSLGVWRREIASDPDYPVQPASFSSLDAACRWIGLSPTAPVILAGAVR
jgi:hypothetical protein